MRHPNAVSLAKRLLDARIKCLMMVDGNAISGYRITAEEIASAEEILAIHLDTCMCAGIHSDLFNAVDESLEFAIRHEKAYEPIPLCARWHGALVVMDERDAD
ncbi:MAG: hypothetical protein ACRD82_20380 [Blastocatellia bacterium]